MTSPLIKRIEMEAVLKQFITSEDKFPINASIVGDWLVQKHGSVIVWIKTHLLKGTTVIKKKYTLMYLCRRGLPR